MAATKRGGWRSCVELATEYRHSNSPEAGSRDPSLRIRRTWSGSATACRIWTEGRTEPAPSPPACCTRRSEERAFRVADGHAVMSTGRNDAASSQQEDEIRQKK
jgi:hypothetical protein